jgi:hypothetical protein
LCEDVQLDVSTVPSAVSEVEKQGMANIPGFPIVGYVQLVIGDLNASTLLEGVVHIPVNRSFYLPACVKIVGKELLVVDREHHIIDIYNIKEGRLIRSLGGETTTSTTSAMSFQSPSYVYVYFVKDRNLLLVSDVSLNNHYCRLNVLDYESGNMLSDTKIGYFSYGLSVDENGQIFNVGSFYGDDNLFIYEFIENDEGLKSLKKNSKKKKILMEINSYLILLLSAVKDSLFVFQEPDLLPIGFSSQKFSEQATRWSTISK